MITAYGVCDDRLLFFEAQCFNFSRPRLESATTRIERVTGGALGASGTAVEEACVSRFPWKEGLARLMVFGICKVSDSACFLEFDQGSNQEPE